LCVDPRDRIFAIYGLLEDATSADFVPDYTKTVSQVYTRSTWSIIKATRSLSLLCLTGLQSDPYIPKAYRSLPYPSWVVDWGSNLSSQSSSLEYQLYHASLESEAIATFHESTHTLTVYGILVDTVWVEDTRDGLGDLFATMKDRDLALNPLEGGEVGSMILQMFPWNSFRTWQEHFKVYPTECDPGYAWVRTITTDIGREEGESKKARLTEKTIRQIYALTRMFDTSAEEMLREFSLSDTDNRDMVLRTVVNLLLRALVDTKEKSFFITREGYFGLGPLQLEEQDMVCVLPGCSVPLLIRKRDYYHVLVGECFVWGLMDGEAMSNRKDDKGYKVFHLQ
jgi:hypothetical protein